jgi:hypothetical protein
MVNMEDLSYKVFNYKLRQVVRCLVIEEENTIQVSKNRGGNKKFDEVKDLEFIKVTKKDVKNCDNIIATYGGKNVWYIIE